MLSPASTTPFSVPESNVDSRAELRQYCQMIVERACTPFEKQEQKYQCQYPLDDSRLSYYLSYWSKVLNPKGKSGRLERFLAFEELGMEDVHRLLSPVRLRAGTPLPDWCTVLEQVISGNTNPIHLKQEQAIPFQEVLAPFIHAFRQGVWQAAPVLGGLLEPAAQKQLEAVLLKRIGFIFSATLQAEFHAFKLDYKGPIVAPDTIYQAFVSQLRVDGFRPLFTKYPLLARISCSCTFQFIRNSKRFLQRLATDQALICERFSVEGPLGKVAALNMDISDQHRGGEAVIIFTFNAGFKIVYKPRNMQINLAYDGLCQWFNQHSSIDLRAARVLDRGNYGWMEFIGSKTCTQIVEVERYYQRAGMLLAITYLLGSTDYHAENILATGEYPMIIDHETLLQPTYQYNLKNLSPEQRKHLEVAQHSVLRAHLLPLKARLSGVETDCISGFGSIKKETGFQARAPQYVDVNTDQMRLEMTTVGKSYTENLPHLENRPQHIDSYQEQFIAGFQEAYDILKTQKQFLGGANSPLHAFAELDLRFVFRPTEVYSSILNNLLHPQYLSDATKYGLRLELIARAFLTKEEKPRYWFVHRQDRKEMLNRDIPYYHLNSSSGVLTINNNIHIDSYFDGSCVDTIHKKLEKLGQEDLAFQLEVINNALQGVYKA